MGWARGCTVRATVARYYDPTTAQFLTRDPLEDETRQPYSYAGDDPLDNSDPSGDFCVGNYCLGFNPGSIPTSITNIGRGMSFGLSDKIANWISPGASCTVAQNSAQQLVGNAAAIVDGVGGLADGISGILATGRILRAIPTIDDVNALLPEGTTLAKWGGPIWGHLASGARALIGARSAEELRALGLTVENATVLRNFYMYAMFAGRGADTAGARVQLMQNIIDTLGW